MNTSLILGILFMAYCAHAQLYGPVPQRPQQFAGATLVQQQPPLPRQNFRQRPSSPRAIPELIQPVDPASQGNRLRRPQSLRKVKAQVSQQQVLDQQRTNLVDDAANPFNGKIGSPSSLPQFQQQQTTKLTPRPVEEEINEEEEIATTVVTTPTTTTYAVPLRQSYPPAPAPAPVLAQPAQVPSGFQRSPYLQQTALRSPTAQLVQPPQTAQYPDPTLQGRQFARQQARPIQQAQVPASRQPIQQVVSPQIAIGPDPGIPEDEQYFRQIQARPAKNQELVRQQTVEPLRQQSIRQPSEVARQQPAVSRAQQEYVRSAQREPHAKASQKERKPVVQTIRKYHEEHEDGSITWGYENDDGSFKEETIGVDCVTRGKYGYYDPDGVKREYTYQTGIPCEKAQESEEAASNQGFIDYTNNKYVLPNGDEIDLEAMVKNRARKPVQQYRY